MVELLGIVDLTSFTLGVIFLILAILIRRKIRLPQNNVLLLVGVTIVIFLSTHIPKYFPELFPFIGDEVRHVIHDLTLLAAVLVLLWYGVTTYMYVRQVVPSH
ncbi:MAG: hypothetical protein ACE5KU_02385, partial [Nitrososphaerales archaeon]